MQSVASGCLVFSVGVSYGFEDEAVQGLQGSGLVAGLGFRV